MLIVTEVCEKYEQKNTVGFWVWSERTKSYTCIWVVENRSNGKRGEEKKEKLEQENMKKWYKIVRHTLIAKYYNLPGMCVMEQ